VITTLDTQPWAPEDQTGNGAFVEVVHSLSPFAAAIYVVSNVRADNSFAIFRSPAPASPPELFDPQPGNKFGSIATYTFPLQNSGFDPAVAYDPATGYIHIVGNQDNADGTVDLVKFTFDTGSDTFVGLPVVLITSARFSSVADIVVIESGSPPVSHTFIATCTLDPTMPDSPPSILTGDTVLGIELDATDSLVSIIVLDHSPNRSGNTYGSVSVVSPNGFDLEVYYQAHPRKVTFKDQLFTINLLNRIAGVWDSSPTAITTYTGRYSADRLTVIQDASGNLYLSQTFYNQITLPTSSLVGNVLLGYKQVGSPPNPWIFKITSGSAANGSIVEATLGITSSGAVRLAYLLKPNVFGNTLAWPFHIATVNLVDMGILDVPGFYNQLNFTWLRGTKSILDDETFWAVVGERETSQSPLIDVPVYVSGFNVPPIAVLVPPSATIYRGQPFTFDGSQTTDADLDPIQYVWTENDLDIANVTLTPNASGNKAIINVAPTIGGAAQFFTVGMAAIDLFPDLITQRHPAQAVTNIQVSGGVITVQVVNDYQIGTEILLYGLQNATFLNDVVVTVATANSSQFTAAEPLLSPPVGSYGPAPDSGFAIASPQFATASVTVPFNAAPTVTFPQEAGSPPVITVPRNTKFTITPVYTGVTDVDDNTTYVWSQTSGTTIQMLSAGQPTLIFKSNGVNVHDEILTFQLIVNDGVNPPVVVIIPVFVVPHNFAELDTHLLSRAIWTVDGITPATISQRNTPQIWGALQGSAMATDLKGIRRTEEIDGSDRYILISPSSVLVYGVVVGGGSPPVEQSALLRKILIPDADQNTVAETHTVPLFAPFTVAVNNAGGHYISDGGIAGSPPLIYVGGAPGPGQYTVDTIESFSPPSTAGVYTFNAASAGEVVVITYTYFANILDALQTESDQTLILTDTNKLYRYSTSPLISSDNPDTTINLVPAITSTLTFNEMEATASHAGIRVIVLSGPEGCLLLQVNTLTFVVQGFLEISLESNLVYGADNVLWVRTSNVESLRLGKVLLGTMDSHGATYETLIDLPHKTILGIWDISKLRNPIVNTGEILFENESTYAGAPQAALLAPPIVKNGQITLTWIQPRLDLVLGYEVWYSYGGVFSLLTHIDSGVIEQYTFSLPSGAYAFKVRASSLDGFSAFSNIQPLSF